MSDKFAAVTARNYQTREHELRDRLFYAFTQSGKHWYFVTLTWAPEHYPPNYTPINLQTFSNVRDRNWDGFRKDRAAWIKKLRRKYGSSMSFHIALELTQKRVPHIHAFIGLEKPLKTYKELKETWTKGRRADFQQITWPTESCRKPEQNKSAWQHACDLAAYVRKQHDASFTMNASSSRDFTSPPALKGQVDQVVQDLSDEQLDDFRNITAAAPLSALLKALIGRKKAADKYAMNRMIYGTLDYGDVVADPVPVRDQAGPVKVLMLQIKREVEKEGWK